MGSKSKAVFVGRGHDFFYDKEYFAKEVIIENHEDEKKDILTLSRQLGKIIAHSLDYNEIKNELEKLGLMKQESMLENTRLHTEKWCYVKKYKATATSGS